MRSFIIAQDDPKFPKKSALLVGPEKPDEEVRRQFYEHKRLSFHPDGWPVLKFFGPTGLEAASVARFKDAKDRAATLEAEKNVAKSEAEATAEAQSKRQPNTEKDKK